MRRATKTLPSIQHKPNSAGDGTAKNIPDPAASPRERVALKLAAGMTLKAIAVMLFVGLIMAIKPGIAAATSPESATTVVKQTAAQLVMFEEKGCPWCVKWNNEIGVIYDRTKEGQIAPLRRVDIHNRRPSDLQFIQRVSFTPTFIVISQGREIGRITGHPGADFFWPMLQEILVDLPSRGRSPDGGSDDEYERPQPIRFQNQKN
ncbi:MAG: hypothetical protein AAFO75_08475 [Pseudomonadota bacterium]